MALCRLNCSLPFFCFLSLNGSIPLYSYYMYMYMYIYLPTYRYNAASPLDPSIGAVV